MNTSPSACQAVKAADHIGWIDSLRVLACFMVVFSHCCDGFVAQFDADRASFLTGTMLGSLMRSCVPLFVMITGVLLLPLPQSSTLGGFYRRRVAASYRRWFSGRSPSRPWPISTSPDSVAIPSIRRLTFRSIPPRDSPTAYGRGCSTSISTPLRYGTFICCLDFI